MKRVQERIKRFVFPVRANYTVATNTGTVETQLAQFMEEYRGFYTGKIMKRNVTQMYQHFLLLHKSRLKRLGLTMYCDFQRMQLENEKTVKIWENKDGKFCHIHAQEYLSGKRSFLYENKKIYTFRQNIGAGYDMIGVRSRETEREKSYICPSYGVKYGCCHYADLFGAYNFSISPSSPYSPTATIHSITMDIITQSSLNW